MLHFLQRCLDKFKSLSESPPSIVPEVKKDEFDLLIERWEKIKPEKLNRVFSSDMSILMVSLSRNTIMEYRKYFDMVIEYFDEDEIVRPLLAVNYIQPVYIGDFFLDGSGRYLDQNIEMKRLKERVILFIQYYQKGTNNVEATFKTQRNLSLTRHLISEIDQLLKIFE